jgi:transcription elongation factor/antiterminator RfaH
MRWYVVHTQSRAEGQALWHLRNQEFRCFLPEICTLRRHARRTELTHAPLFPRYLFVEFDLEESRWRAINGTRGVIGVLTQGTHPTPVRRGVVEDLIDRRDDSGTIPLTALSLFTEGTQVRITSGPFTGQLAKVQCLSARDRVVVLLNFMGVQTRLRIPPYAVEAA